MDQRGPAVQKGPLPEDVANLPKLYKVGNYCGACLHSIQYQRYSPKKRQRNDRPDTVTLCHNAVSRHNLHFIDKRAWHSKTLALIDFSQFIL